MGTSRNISLLQGKDSGGGGDKYFGTVVSRGGGDTYKPPRPGGSVSPDSTEL